MLNLVKSNSVAGLEKQLADKQAKLAQLRSQYGEVRTRADELGDAVAAALVDDAANLQSLEGQLFAAESRLRSTQAAIAKVDAEVSNLAQRLEAEKDRVAREASAARLRQLAKDLAKLKPAAAKATLDVAEIVGQLPAKALDSLPSATAQILKFWTPACNFYAGDVLDLTADFLRTVADEILAGTRPSDPGHSLDQQADLYGRKPSAKASQR
jgi:hypothetical protein